MPEKPLTGKEQTEPKNPWLEGAIKMSEELKKEPEEVQESIRRMSRKTYPETWKAIREKEQQDS